MKWKLDARSVCVGLVAGAVAGGLGGYLLSRERARRECQKRLDTAVNEVKAHYSRPLLKNIAEIDLDTLVPGRRRYSDVVRDTLGAEPVPDPLEGIGDGHEDSLSGDEADGSASEGTGADADDELLSTGPVPEDEHWEEPPGPFEISEAQFGELVNEGFQTISVVFFAGDNVLCDDRDEPIRDVGGTVGALSAAAFDGQASGDKNIRYVRNRRLESDFEILLKPGSYVDEVLGYGDPARKKQNSGTKAAR